LREEVTGIPETKSEFRKRGGHSSDTDRRTKGAWRATKKVKDAAQDAPAPIHRNTRTEMQGGGVVNCLDAGEQASAWGRE
jgi:hypothetical protein